MGRAGLLMMFWLAVNWLAGTTGCAAACPQDPPQQRSDEASPKKNVSPPGEESSSKAMKNRKDQEAALALPERPLGLGERFLRDQEQIWTSPANLRLVDAEWLVPAGSFASALFVTDSEVSRHLSHAPKTLSHYDTLSNAGVGALVGGAGGLWLLGHVRHDSHWSETGFLSGEAALNSLLLVEEMKFSLGRERPLQGDGSGPFFQGGASFPADHAAVAWAVAGVVSHEYPGPFTKLMAYGLASLVSYSRVRAREHFPSDVFVGSMIGNMVSQNIYSRHHDPELGGEHWQSFGEFVRGESASHPSIPGSPHVPLDSWIYPAIERLAAQGYIDAAFLGSRPWTRIECAKLVQEAGDKITDGRDGSSEPHRLYQTLSNEFASDLEALEAGSESTIRLESLYTQSTEISGTPLNDSYHFGQTIINNFGRPYQQGFNTVDGFSGWAADGRFTIYVRGEYQHAPSAPGLSQPVQNLIASLDNNPVQTAGPIAATNQFRLLDTYVSTALAGWDFAFGKQSLWWGQGEGGALLFSDNAEPIYMFRGSRVVPISLPWILRYLGPMKIDAFIGQLAGNQFPARPVLHGETISFKPTRNLELTFSWMAELGGVGRALTPAAIWNSYTSFRESNFFSSNDNPGKRTAGFGFSYRVPFLRDWLTLYTDSLTSDDISPLDAPRRAAVNPGIYVTHFPKLSKLDLRVEGVNTDTVTSSRMGQYVYYDNYYHDLSTNKGNLIGSWIGRDGQGIQAWSNYWFNARSSLQFGYRHAMVGADFIPRGETLNDESIQANWWMKGSLNVSVSVQHETWVAPVLAPTPQTNWTSSIEIGFHPQRGRHQNTPSSPSVTPSNSDSREPSR
jgi:hypothetical protein